MGGMSKLLHKPLKLFVAYAFVVLLLSMPVYFAVVDYIWQDELDENNQVVRQRIEHGLQHTELNDSSLVNLLDAWSKIQPGVIITATDAIKPDSVYDAEAVNPYSPIQEVNRYRALSSYITIKGKPYHLVVRTNIEESHETIMALGIVTAVFVLLLVIGLIVLNTIIGRSIWKPFNNTLDKLKGFDLNKGEAIKFEATDIEEFYELNATLNKLIAGNIAAYRQQKEFTENASHELQTPLALIKTKVDMLLQDKTLTQEQSEQISALNVPLARVSRINKNLLLLAKIENHQYADEEQVDISALVNENIELFADYFAEKDLKLSIDVAKGIVIKGNKHLIEILITNLLVNAIRYTGSGGQVTVQSTAKAFTISNTGNAALNSDMLFKRFKTSSNNTPNTGLGLAIVHEVAKRYGWNVSYTYHNNLHVFQWQY